MSKRKRITGRTMERLHRAAYEYEYLASVAKAEGHDDLADALRDISSKIGKCARAFDGRFT